MSKLHVDDIRDMIYRVRRSSEENELTAEEALDLLEEEISQYELEYL